MNLSKQNNYSSLTSMFRIGFDIICASLIPILTYFILSIFVDKNLINIFSLTYPIQAFGYILSSIFITGANISSKKNNKTTVDAGICWGFIIGSVLLLIYILFYKNYISFMNMSVETYGLFSIYAVAHMFFQFLLEMFLNKLYFSGETKKANSYSIIYHIINILFITIFSIIIKETILLIILLLIIESSLLIFYFLKNPIKFTLKLNIKECIKYDSASLISNIIFFITYLFGFSTVFMFGEKYTKVLTFVTLITDTQWDAANSIHKTVQIDICNKIFDYKNILKCSYIYMLLLLSSIFILALFLFDLYNLELYLVLIFLSFDVFGLLITPITKIQISYLQLEGEYKKATFIKSSASFIRTFFSFINTPFCTGFGLVFYVIYMIVLLNSPFKKLINKKE